MTTFVFPGQGSQQKGMGADLFDSFEALTKIADEILGYSIKNLCLNNPDQLLSQTEYTQPSMYVVNALSYLKRIQVLKKEPDYLAGHSLGEYNALHAAGVISFEAGLKLVKKRGELMGRVKNGSMAAVINFSEKQVIEILKKVNLTTIDIANLNSPSQIVISGLKDDIDKAQPHFEIENGKYVLLNTSGAFHSRYMVEAKNEFEDFIKSFEFDKPKIPVISNVTALPYDDETIMSNICNQIIKCVRWTDSIEFLLTQGEIEFEEIGVGSVLTKLIQNIESHFNLKDKRTPEDCITAGQNSRNGEGDKIETNPNYSAELLKFSSANELVDYWNKTYPIGTKIISDRYETELETSTEAMVLFGHRAAVYMKGFNGYFDLKEVTPIE